MGVAFDTAFPGGRPSATTYDFVSFHDSLMEFRRNESPIARGTNIYIQQSDAGNATGGSGNGSISNPYLIDTVGNLDTFINANVVSDVRFLCKGRFQSGTGIAMSGDSDFTISSWGDGEDFILDGFISVEDILSATPSWTDNADNSFEIDLSGVFSGAVYAVREIGDEPCDYSYRPYSMADSAANVPANEKSWHWDNVGKVLTIHTVGAANPDSTIEICTAEGGAVVNTSCNNWRLHDVKIYGWSMDTGDTSPYAVTVLSTGTQTSFISNCEVFWSNWHAIGHVNSGTGGIMTLESCDAGLADTSGDSATVYVGFSLNGGHEFLMHDCRTVNGTMPRTDAAIYRGQGFFAHTGSGSANLIIIRNHYTELTPYSGLTIDGSISNINATGDLEAESTWTGLSFGCTFDGKGYSGTGQRLLRNASMCFGYKVNCKYLNLRPVCDFNGQGGNPPQTLTVPTSANSALIVNCVFQIDLSDDTDAQGLGLWAKGGSVGGSARLNGGFFFCHFDITHDAGNRLLVDSLVLNNTGHWYSLRTAAYNSIFSGNTSDRLEVNLFNNVPGNGNDLDGSDLGDWYGGMRNCAYYNCLSSGNSNPSSMGYDESDNPITLSSSPVPLGVPATSSDLYDAASTAMPITVEFDANLERRTGERSVNSIGPITTREVPVYQAPIFVATDSRRESMPENIPLSVVNNYRDNSIYLSYSVDYLGINFEHESTRWQFRRKVDGALVYDFSITNNGPVPNLEIILEHSLTDLRFNIDKQYDYEFRLRPNSEDWTPWTNLDLSSEMRRIGGIHRDQYSIQRTENGRLIVDHRNPKYTVRTLPNGRVVVTPQSLSGASRPSRQRE